MKIINFCTPDISLPETFNVLRVLRSGSLSHGVEIEKFEQDFAKYVGVEYAISFSSWTSAAVSVLIKLRESEIDKGGKRFEVIVPSFSFVASANVIVNAGLTPVFVDVSNDDYMVNFKLIESAITAHTLAIMPVHFAGNPAPLKKIHEYCQKHGIYLLEDCAEILGIRIDGKHVGSFDIGIFSFYGTKNMTTAEGGMVTTNRAEIANWLKIYRAHGINKSKRAGMQNWNRDASIWGQNYRLSNLQAALGRSQLKRVDSMNKKRSEIAKIYNGFFRYMPGVKTNLNDNSSFQMYYIEVKTHLRDLIVQQLNRKGVMASVHFDPPIHLQSVYSEFSIPLLNTERISKSVITLPMSSKLTKREAKKVCKVFSEVYKDLE